MSVQRGDFVSFIFDDSTLRGHVVSDEISTGLGRPLYREVMDDKGRFIMVEEKELRDPDDPYGVWD